jgi:hypothetical protein
LIFFAIQPIAKNKSRSDFRIQDLMHYVDPVSLYIATKPNDKARLKPLIRIVVNMIDRLLTAAGNIYYARQKELIWLLKAAEKAGICLDHSTVNKSANPRIIRVCSANKDQSSQFPEPNFRN